MTTASVPTFYEILDLPIPRHGELGHLTKEQYKTAYHRALLLNHPDKSPRTVSKAQHEVTQYQGQGHKYSIDEIVLAYQTLSDENLRKRYDSQLLARQSLGSGGGKGFDQQYVHLGVEVFDLDDLQYHEKDSSWSKPCRCGNATGYMVREEDLEKESGTGELYIGCQGCSLFIKVLFHDAEGLAAS